MKILNKISPKYGQNALRFNKTVIQLYTKIFEKYLIILLSPFVRNTSHITRSRHLVNFVKNRISSNIIIFSHPKDPSIVVILFTKFLFQYYGRNFDLKNDFGNPITHNMLYIFFHYTLITCLKNDVKLIILTIYDATYKLQLV